jgi:uncharacterized protein YcbK (DUF882 family)
MEYQHDDLLFPLVREPASRWERAGLTQAQERRFDRVATVMVGVFLAGWAYTLVLAPRDHLPDRYAPVARVTGQLVRSPLSATSGPEAAFVVNELANRLADDFARRYAGESGAVRVAIVQPGEAVELPEGVEVPEDGEVVLVPADGDPAVEAPATAPAAGAGIWNLMIRFRDALRPAGDFNVITLVPITEKRGGRIGPYLIGDWPFEGGRTPPQPIYRTPAGLIEVTEENQHMYLSERIQLRHFLTKGQEGVWPKYVAVDPRILDKLELTFQEMERMGYPVENVFAISGFRTPHYNAGGGDPRGRGQLSRHMYGDAMDIAIDNDRDGLMDDLNGDGRVDVRDLRIIVEAAERVERRYPHLIGGIGIYPPTGGHRGMVHIDARGFRARW